ncbi:MAG: hypothetical protein K8R63_11060 [Bacteroidales bacterium]|nr:hypothetical protein [Bacteroidales bacterium]
MEMQIISLALGLMGQFTKLSQNPNIKPVINGLSDWIGNIFSKHFVKDKLKQVKENRFDDETISELKVLLKHRLEDEEELLKQLEEKISEVIGKVNEEGLQDQVERNIVTITGDKNVVLTGFDTSGDININID